MRNKCKDVWQKHLKSWEQKRCISDTSLQKNVDMTIYGISKKKAFTLVELIVVITILAILWTIGFMSFRNYNVYARDSVRLSNLKTLQSSLWIQYVQSNNYALPDDSVNITASWTVIRKQWVFWKQALRTVKASKWASKDPLTEEYFDY